MAGKTTAEKNTGHLDKRRRQKRLKNPPPNPRLAVIRAAMDSLRKELASFPHDHFKRVSAIQRALRAFQMELKALTRGAA